MYKPVIGLEIHVELNTKTKMFCRCSSDYFGASPNSHTCPVCLGLPGALPYINQEAIQKCLMIGIALNCRVNENSRFERKNYFYPDLPKGYQISQYRWPLSVGGRLEAGGISIRINRVHQEEDTGKLMHQGESTVVDFNRSGVPLVEIVTEPDFDNSEQVREFAKKLQQLFRYLKVSEADMEKGQMRLEANVSVRKVDSEQGTGDSWELPDYRIELKNINSFSFMAKAIEYEIKRQTEELEQGRTLTQETRGWDQDKNATYLQRAKEDAHDYRYFPEPDLPELKVKDQGLGIRESMVELPWAAEARLINLGITQKDAEFLTENSEITEYFEDAVKEAITHQVSPKEVANVLINQKIDIKSTSVVELIEGITNKKASVVTDDEVIEGWVKEVLQENPKLVEEFKNGKINVLQALVGAVMRKSQGKADASLVHRTLENELT